jgi:hypothetical protein
MIELQKEYAQQLLGHESPYTKLKYTYDPAVALVEINNENALNIAYRAPSPFYLQELAEIYNQWLLKHRIDYWVVSRKVRQALTDRILHPGRVRSIVALGGEIQFARPSDEEPE